MTKLDCTARKILVVDDEPDIREALRLRLISEGYDVTACERGIDATILLLEHQRDGQCFDVVILDCSLPYYDGFTIARILRLSEKTGLSNCRAWVGVYTAYARTVEHSTLVETSGVDAYWVKGSDESRMIEQISRWLAELAQVEMDEIDTES